MITHRTRAALLPFVIAIALTACSDSDTGSDSTTVAGSDGSAPSDTGDVATTIAGADGTPITFGSGSFQLSDPAIGMENLAAFEATLNVTFEGTRDGAVEQWTQTETAATSREPVLEQFTSERIGTGAFVLQHFAIGGVDYDRGADGSCIASVRAADSDAAPDLFALRRHPGELLPALIGGVEAGSETIGEVETVHYTFDASGLGLSAPVTATGDVWVATEGDYVVRYSLVIDGASPYLGVSVTGHYTVDYEQRPLAAPPEVAVPADCPAGLIDAAPPADATDVVNRPGLQTFTSASALADLQAWYEQQLETAGWAAVTAPLISGENELLTYSRGSERLAVSMSRSGAATTVILLLTKTG